MVVGVIEKRDSATESERREGSPLIRDRFSLVVGRYEWRTSGLRRDGTAAKPV